MKLVLAAGAILATAATTLVVAASPASASTTCFTKSKHYGISDGSISIRVGYTDFHVEVCTNGNAITSSTGSVGSDTTGPGDAAGFDLAFGGAYRTTFTSGGPVAAGRVTYASAGRLRDCIPYTTTFCSDSENFDEHAVVEMSNLPDRIPYRLPTGSGWFAFDGRWFRVTWAHACTNKVCAVKFH